MLNVALVGLLATSLLSGGTGDDRTQDRKDDQKTPVAQESVVILDDASDAVGDRSPIISDTWALGRSSSASPIKLWIEGGWGQAGEIYGPNGETMDPSVGPGGALIGGGADIVSTRALVGVEISPFEVAGLSVGVGGTLSAAKNEIKGSTGLIADNRLESDFSVQNVKIYGALRGRALGVHAGYMLDLGDEQEFDATTTFPTDITRSDNRDAINFGIDFDYPSETLRLFGGVDYYWLQEDTPIAGGENTYGEEGDDLINWMLGAGFRFSVFEIGAAGQLVTRMRQPVERNGEGTAGTTGNIGGHVASIAPYLRISPQSLPASIYVKGGVMDEYNTYGYGIGGANGPRPTIGVTGGLAIGFN